MKQKKIPDKFPYLLLLPAFAFLGFIVIFSGLYNIYISFFSMKLTRPGLGRYVGLWNYVDLLCNPLFHKVLKNSIVWTVGSVIPIVLIGLFLAVILNQKLRIAAVARVIIILPWIVPGVVVATVWRLLLHADFGLFNDLLFRLGLINSHQAWLGKSSTAMLGVIIANVWKGIPFYVVLFYAALQTIPEQLYEAAKMDGANMWQNFAHITMPQLKSVFGIAIALAFMWSWNFFDLIFVMTEGGPARSTEIMPIHIYSTGFLYYRMSDAATISVFLILVFFMCFLPYQYLQKRKFE